MINCYPKICKAILSVGHLQIPNRNNSRNWHALSFYVKCGRKTLSFERQTKNTWNKIVEITTFSFLHHPGRLRKGIQAAQEFILKTCEIVTWKKSFDDLLHFAVLCLQSFLMIMPKVGNVSTVVLCPPHCGEEMALVTISVMHVDSTTRWMALTGHWSSPRGGW